MYSIAEIKDSEFVNTFDIKTLIKGNLIGFQIEKYSFAKEIKYNDNFIPIFPQNEKLTLRLYSNATTINKIALTEHQHSCNYLIAHSDVNVKPAGNNMALVEIIVPSLLKRGTQVFICAKEDGGIWIHQGTEKRLSFIVEKSILPSWFAILLMAICIIVSALCNGLTVGLMSLDVTELNVLEKAGTQNQRKYARIILPVRKKANFLLVTLLLGATIFNTIFTLVTDSYVQSWITVLIVTVVILLFCEILPSAIFTRYALRAGAKTICVPYFFMYLSFPISFTLGKILDKLLGEDMTRFTKAKLKEMVKITDDMQKQEKDIIAGALEMNTKTVEDVMTHVHDIYMLPINTYLDYTTVAEILSTGYSRIPIYEGERANIVNVLYTKDLILLDPEDRIPVKVLLKLTKLENLYIPAGTTLDKVFLVFKEDPSKRHLALVYEAEQEEEQRKTVIGLVTLEDIIEEVVQFEIVDEFDTIDIDRFNPDIMSPKILQKVLNQKNVIYHYNPKEHHHIPKNKIFDKSSINDAFVMLLEGRVEILIGKEKIRCENGPFFYFGLSNLNDENDQVNDCEVLIIPIGEIFYLKIRRGLYLAGLRATLAEKTGEKPDLNNESYINLFQDEDNKLEETTNNVASFSGKK